MKQLEKWVKIKRVQYTTGECSAVALATFFNTTRRDIMVMLSVLARNPEHGIDTITLNKAMKYGEFIYGIKASKFLWRGSISNFIVLYPTGTYLLNCAGHITIVVDGIVYAKNRADYQVYSVFKLAQN